MPKEEYGAKDLSVLEGLDAVRKRPGMYIGTTDSQGLMHCLWEIIDNSVDEALAGFCNNIVVTLHTDGSVEVADNGRGIPVDKEPKTGLSGVEVVLTKLHAGAKFGNSSYNAVGGLHGVGSSVVNALSSRLDVEVDRDGKTHHMAFHQGHPGVYADADPVNPSPDSPFKRTRKNKPTELEIIGKVSPKTTGTRIRYWYDPEIFNKTAEFSYEQLIDRVRQTSFLVPGLKITIVDENVPKTNGADTVGTEPNEDVAVVAESLNADETANATESFSGEDPHLTDSPSFRTMRLLTATPRLRTRRISRCHPPLKWLMALLANSLPIRVRSNSCTPVASRISWTSCPKASPSPISGVFRVRAPTRKRPRPWARAANCMPRRSNALAA